MNYWRDRGTEDMDIYGTPPGRDAAPGAGVKAGACGGGEPII